MGRMAIGSVSVVLLLAVMLVLLPRFRNEADEIYQADEPNSDDRSTPSPPPAGVSFNAPTSNVFSSSSHRRGRHRSSSPTMGSSWDASQVRQNTANMAAMGASNSVIHQSQIANPPQSNFQQSVAQDAEQPPPRPKSLDVEETIQPEQTSVEDGQKQVAESNGVMLACDGTIQGQTGWYHDGMGNTSYWQVDEVGTWTRLG